MKVISWIIFGISIFLIFSFLPSTIVASNLPTLMNATSTLLTDPFLQLPTEDSVNVVWFTEFIGSEHKVIYGEKFERVSIANTTKLSRVSEDKDSKINPTYDKLTPRNIWRHEAVVSGLSSSKTYPYKVVSQDGREKIESKIFNLAAKPQSGTSLKILLTSDHQLMPMVAANLQKVGETIDKIDAVFVAGDLINAPDRASEWFDDSRGGAFFPCLQGRANYTLEKEGIKTVYKGAELIQNAPLFAAIGNHEVMGRFSNKTLKEQFEDAHPVAIATKYYQQSDRQINPNNDPQIKENWIRDNSFNTNSYQEILTLPESDGGGKEYYAESFGDIRLITLYVTNIWRSYSLTPDTKGRYREREEDLNSKEKWGYGQIILGDIRKGSSQYDWLQTELNSEAFKNAKYKIVMFHHPPHTLGDNIVPAFTDPVPKIQTTPDGKVKSVFYEYPIADDYIIRDLIPLLESAGVNLVFYGHSHLWNRFVSPSGMNFLETSNVGNSYGAYLKDKKRPIPTNDVNLNLSNYKEVGDPNGLEPIVPTIAPLSDEKGQPQAYISSNDITVFSILDTKTGTISSYRFDTRKPDSEVVKFDEFAIDDRK
ncbi:MAG: metallophosphoesterase family protein [Xenococcaceae cyanobacterium]